MNQRNRFNNNRQKPRTRTPQATTSKEEPSVRDVKAVIQYGKPFILLEDGNKNTFDYQGGQWVPHSISIAECQQTCLVKELPQKVKGMTRYQIQSPLVTA
jgi:hypothetical protein